MLKNEKTIYLMGGLGNVLFQINFGYYLIALGYKVNFATLLISSNKVLNLILNWTDHKTLIDLKELKLDSRINFVSGNIFVLFMFSISKILKKGFLNYTYDGLSSEVDYKKYQYFLGYYHENLDISNRLTKDLGILCDAYLTANQELSKQVKKVKNSDLLHYRAGDYLKEEYRKISDEYYINVLSDKEIVYLISNDHKYAKKEILRMNPLLNVESIFGKNALDDFVIISKAKNLILPNSTFSWWAAEISNAKNIFQPEPFFSHVKWNPRSNKINRIKIKVVYL